MSMPFSPSVRVGTPSEPPLSAYELLTDKERMMRGFLYKPWIPELNANRLRGQKLTVDYNATSPGDTEKRRAVLAELLDPDSKGKSLLVEPPFRVDYGDNFEVHYII
jgi:maltose O-acetyltransferase